MISFHRWATTVRLSRSERGIAMIFRYMTCLFIFPLSRQHLLLTEWGDMYQDARRISSEEQFFDPNVNTARIDELFFPQKSRLRVKLSLEMRITPPIRVFLLGKEVRSPLELHPLKNWHFKIWLKYEFVSKPLSLIFKLFEKKNVSESWIRYDWLAYYNSWDSLNLRMNEMRNFLRFNGMWDVHFKRTPKYEKRKWKFFVKNCYHLKLNQYPWFLSYNIQLITKYTC